MPDDRTLSMLKAALPFLKPPMKDTVKTWIQLSVLAKTMEQLNQEEEEIMACSPSADQATIYDLYQAVRGYCTPRETDTLDMLVNIAQMAHFYQDYETGGATGETV